MDGDQADGAQTPRAARHAPIAWRRLSRATLLGFSLTVSQGTMENDGGPGAAQASPLAAAADLRVSLGETDWRVAPNDGFSYRVTVTNHGNAAAPAYVETVLHPELSNVTVAASGFACTRQFEAAAVALPPPRPFAPWPACLS